MELRLLSAVSACFLTLVITLRTSINANIARIMLLVAGCLVAATVNAWIHRANLDGSEMTNLVIGYTGGIALDVGGGQMYWTDDFLGEIQRANLDGSGVTDVVTGLNGPRDIALDVRGGQMYWTDSWAGKIQRANLDGSGVTDLVTGLNGPNGIALDVEAGHIYFNSGGFQDIYLGGTIKTTDGTDICAMVMASGHYKFSCNPPRGILTRPRAVRR